MAKPQRRYHSYLLRMWQTSDGKRQIWRASLESPGSGERLGFADLKDLFDFLQGQTEHTDENCGSDTRGGGGGDVATNF